MDYNFEVAHELNELKAEALANMESRVPEKSSVAEDFRNEAAVFLDTRDEKYIAVMQTDESINYTVYAPD